VLRRLFIATVAVCLPCLFLGCASTATIHADDEIYPHAKVGLHFIVPARWRWSPQGEFTGALVPVARERVVITLLANRNTWETQSEQKSAQDFLYYVQHEHDPNASLQIVDSFDARRYGLRHVYRCCTNYNSFVNEWLVVFITEGPNAVDIDAWTPDCGSTMRYLPIIKTIARSIRIENT
jgi:hypothetical protein